MHLRHPSAAALFAGRDRDRAPVRDPLVGALAGQAQDRTRTHQRLDRGDAEFGRLLDQRVHAFVGRHAERERHAQREFALDRMVLADLHVDRAAAHASDARAPLAAGAVEQPQRRAGLQPQHLHMARGGIGQRQAGAAAQRAVDVQAGWHEDECA